MYSPQNLIPDHT